jgi:hypothetical protein
MYAADSRPLMRALPLQEFSIFDFDTYGSRGDTSSFFVSGAGCSLVNGSAWVIPKAGMEAS